MSKMFIDEMDYDTCWKLWDQIYRYPIITARLLFPNKPPVYVVITKLIGAYAANKGTALGLASGDAKARQMYIDIAAKIYTKIPAWGRSFNIDFLNEEK